MAVTQHKAPVRTALPFWVVNELELPFEPDEARRYANLMRAAGASFAMGVIRHLLKQIDASSRPKTFERLGQVPFGPTQVQGLKAALHFLRRHRDGILESEHNP
jgi:hypothetical protein